MANDGDTDAYSEQPNQEALKHLLLDATTRAVEIADTRTISGREKLKRLILNLNAEVLTYAGNRIQQLEIEIRGADSQQARMEAMQAAAKEVLEMASVYRSAATTAPSKVGGSALGIFVRSRLPEGDMVTRDDKNWLDECDRFLTSPASNVSVVEATKRALEANPSGHIDPFELLLDAGICDRMCNPLPE